MNILEHAAHVLNSDLLPQVKPKHRNLFKFGYLALSLKPFGSLNSNARSVEANRFTAETKIFRLTSKPQFELNFLSLLKHLPLVTRNDYVNVDFSSFCGFETLAFAKQTRSGRALPLQVNALTYPILFPGSQTLFVEEQFETFIAAVGFSPRFVMDRGFQSSHIANFLNQKGCLFYLRTKEVTWRKFKERDCLVERYGLKLRIVVSEKPNADDPPWYILTNDFKSSWEAVLSNYYYRFEIEETFKDLKHLHNLEKLQIKKVQSFVILLWFKVLALWLAYLLEPVFALVKGKSESNPRKALSIFRAFSEQLERELWQPFYPFVLINSP